jgi:hypothetical protein
VERYADVGHLLGRGVADRLGDRSQILLVADDLLESPR